MLTKRNVARYYPDTNKTPKGHLNQSRKNVRSTKPKRTPLQVPKTSLLEGHKACDIYISLYEIRITVFYNQTGQFPTHSQQGNKYIMFMVEIDSNAVLVKPIKNRKEGDLKRAYRTMMRKNTKSRNDYKTIYTSHP